MCDRIRSLIIVTSSDFGITNTAVTFVELIYVVATAMGIGVFLFAVRRASRKQLGKPKDAQALDAPPTDQPVSAASEQPAEDVDDAESSEASDLNAGLAKTRGGFVARLGKLLSRKAIDQSILEELEDVLLTADIGPRTADALFQTIKGELSRAELADPDVVWDRVLQQSEAILNIDAKPIDFEAAKPFVLLTIGVNGVGKTTTIGKLAAKFSREGKRVLLAAGDTFRAAAVEQLEIWGKACPLPRRQGQAKWGPIISYFRWNSASC